MVRSPEHVDSPVGMEEGPAGNVAVAKRQVRTGTRRSARRPRRGAFRTVAQVVGELLITAGVILLLFVTWELWWTNLEADNTQQQAVARFVHDVQGPVAPATVPGNLPKDYGKPVVMTELKSPGTVFGVVYIPRFGKDYSRPLVDGTAPAQLNTLGLGHYETSAMPGGVGNFAVAGHRQTHGAVLDAIHTLVPGDKIYIQTKDGYYTYVFRNDEIVLPDRADVLLPVPTQPGAKPTERLLTMTSCNPRFGSEERIVAYSVMDSWRPASAGPPEAIAAQVAANRARGQ
ncbi:class E sortase [Arthrobacter sp.]|uniref:class E sortase n=1 Tax=Arthrobacter sp. TaxID=1667 RepID=UPI002588F7AF|nr:class E sortase [Arthrobacter sp.]